MSRKKKNIFGQTGTGKKHSSIDMHHLLLKKYTWTFLSLKNDGYSNPWIRDCLSIESSIFGSLY